MNRRAWLLLRIFPRAWRDRYGAEVLELLAASRRPGRDLADVLRAAALLRLDSLLRSADMHKIALSAAALLVLGALWITWAIPRLARGAAELPQHWWSAPGLLFLLAGAILAGVAGTMRRRRRS
jgi:hypothetical protein